MNELIRELAEQAGITTNLDTYCEKDMNKWVDYYSEKFAELIIKECEVALNPMLRDMISRGQAVDLIERHFGIEEPTRDQQLRNRSTYFGNNP
jgi:hypothetical protein